jgi:hypothetical protein
VLGYAAMMPQVFPDTTSLGLSSAQLRELRASGQTGASIIYDTSLTRMPGQLTLLEQGIRMPVLIEGEAIEVPVVHARGEFSNAGHQAQGDLYILDNQDNPMLIQYSLTFTGESQPRTEKIIRVTAGSSQRAKMEQALRTLKSYDLYGIHFDFRQGDGAAAGTPADRRHRRVAHEQSDLAAAHRRPHRLARRCRL